MNLLHLYRSVLTVLTIALVAMSYAYLQEHQRLLKEHERLLKWEAGGSGLAEDARSCCSYNLFTPTKRQMEICDEAMKISSKDPDAVFSLHKHAKEFDLDWKLRLVGKLNETFDKLDRCEQKLKSATVRNETPK